MQLNTFGFSGVSTATLYIDSLSPITQYSVSESELSSRTLWLSVWDWDRFGRNQFLGEIKVPLKSLDLRNETELWYTLVDKVCAQ